MKMARLYGRIDCAWDHAIILDGQYKSFKINCDFGKNTPDTRNH
jgi:hypothetical protein